MSRGSACHDKALRLLARRAHFRRELEEKLARKGFERDEIETVCDALERGRLLDDRRAARDLVEGPLQRRGYGPLRLRAELERRGVAEEIVDEVLAGGSEEGELEQASRLARRWLASHHPDRGRLARHLQGKGYRRATVYRVVERLVTVPEGDGAS